MIAFWISLGLVVYTYVLYPVILLLWSRLKNRNRQDVSSQPNSLNGFFPTVTVVIAAYNEEAVLEEKIKNLQATNYPAGRISFLIGSDGSIDGTNDVLLRSDFSLLQTEIFPQRRGKASVLNDLIPNAEGEIIVLSDANTFYQRDTISLLVRHFNDPSVGAVVGELVLESDVKTNSVQGEVAYWTFENTLKKLESDIHSTLGATGPLYAIRKTLFSPLPTTKIVMDDFLIPIGAIAKGYVIRYESAAVAYEKTSETVAKEFRRKVRIGAANFHGIAEYVHLLSPRYGFTAFALWSHKILRWCVPFFLFTMIVTSSLLSLDSQFFRLIVFAEAIIVGLIIVGGITEALKSNIGIVGLPYYFAAMNAAIAVGFFKFLFNHQKPTWDMLRHNHSDK